MISGIAQFLLRGVGRAFEVSNPVPTADSAGERKCTSSKPQALPTGVTHWQLASVRLRAGWYMLEVAHSLDSIGCILTLNSAVGPQEHLLLTSKPVCKRIIRLDDSLDCFTVNIDQAACSITRLALVGLSSRFAMSRMRNRLQYRGGEDVADDDDAIALYRAYQAHVHGALFPASYRAADTRVVDAQFEPARVSDSVAELHLVLHRPDPREGVVSGSFSLAAAFVREQGGSVDWADALSHSFSQYPKKRVFHMWVPLGSTIRVDALQKMLTTIDDESILVYADHDHVDAAGYYCEPILKPEWNPELLLSMNYVQFPWMIAESWLRQVVKVEPSVLQRYDLLLLIAALGIGETLDSASNQQGRAHALHSAVEVEKYVEAVQPLTAAQVRRIPQVLFSLSLTNNHVLGELAESTSTWAQNVRFVLSKIGSAARVSIIRDTQYCHVRWPLPLDPPLVDIVVPSRDNVKVLKACIDSILNKTTYKNYRILLVDNDSQERETEAYYDSLKTETRVRLLRYSGVFNYSAINNYAVSSSDSPVIVLLNNDTEVISPGWLEEMVSQAIRPDIACVGAKLYYSNGRIQHAGVIVGIMGVAGHAHRYSPAQAEGYNGRLMVSQNYTAVTAACLAVRRELYLHVGGLDEIDLGVAWNDVDFCMKLNAIGYRNVWTPHAELFHHEGLSRGADNTRSKVQRVDAERRVMINRWGLDRFVDSAYHPLLSHESEGFHLGKTLT